jgi:hypothetical protein
MTGAMGRGAPEHFPPKQTPPRRRKCSEFNKV